MIEYAPSSSFEKHCTNEKTNAAFQSGLKDSLAILKTIDQFFNIAEISTIYNGNKSTIRAWSQMNETSEEDGYKKTLYQFLSRYNTIAAEAYLLERNEQGQCSCMRLEEILKAPAGTIEKMCTSRVKWKNDLASLLLCFNDSLFARQIEVIKHASKADEGSLPLRVTRTKGENNTCASYGEGQYFGMDILCSINKMRNHVEISELYGVNKSTARAWSEIDSSDARNFYKKLIYEFLCRLNLKATAALMRKHKLSGKSTLEQISEIFLEEISTIDAMMSSKMQWKSDVVDIIASVPPELLRHQVSIVHGSIRQNELILKKGEA